MPTLAFPDGRTLCCTPFTDALAEQGAYVMGILNITPDSFSDGGRFLLRDAALRRAEEMVREGTTFIDVGGESTRPAGSAYGTGAPALSEAEECDRVIPVIEAIAHAFPNVFISVDTYKSGVARAALAAGAHMVNDVTGLRSDPTLADVAAEAGAPLVVMHAVGAPGAFVHELEHTDVVSDVAQSLLLARDEAYGRGVRNVVVDAGFGFGKTPHDNLRLMGQTAQIRAVTGCPVLVGISRKSTISKMLGSADHPVPVQERLFGTLGVTAVAVLEGATLVRTHDVRPTVEFLRLLAQTRGAAIGKKG